MHFIKKHAILYKIDKHIGCVKMGWGHKILVFKFHISKIKEFHKFGFHKLGFHNFVLQGSHLLALPI